MRNSNFSVFSVIPIAFSIWLSLVLGCGGGGSSVRTERWGCITPDGSRIGLAKDFTTFLIDADSGKLLRTEKGENFAGVVCLDDNKVIAVYPKFALDLTGNKRIDRNERTFTIVGASRSEGVVHYSGGKLASSKSSYSSPLEVYYEKFGTVTESPKTLVLPPEKFEGLAPKKPTYWMIPVRVLNDGKLLVAAGSSPNHSVGSSGETRLNPEPWGFFSVTPETGEVENFGVPKIQDDAINFRNVPKTYATPDGKFVAITSTANSKFNFAVWSEDGNKEIFRKNITNAQDLLDIIVSDDGTRAAVQVSLPGGYEIRVYDIRTNTLINAFSFSRSSTEFLSLKNNELVLADYYRTVAKIDVETGRNVWLTKLETQNSR